MLKKIKFLMFFVAILLIAVNLPIQQLIPVVSKKIDSEKSLDN